MLTCANGVLAQLPFCDCGLPHTVNHIVNPCPLTEVEGGLNLFHKVDDDAVIWLESTATAALAKEIISLLFYCVFIAI